MNWIKNLYQTNAWFRGIVQAVEGGFVMGLAQATAAGFDFSRTGWKALGLSVGTGVAIAVRNYLVNRPGSPAGLVPNPEQK